MPEPLEQSGVVTPQIVATDVSSRRSVIRRAVVWLVAVILVLASVVVSLFAPALREIRAIARLRAAGAKVDVTAVYLTGKDTMLDRCELALARWTGIGEFKRGDRRVELPENVPAADFVLVKSLRDINSITLRGPQWNDSHLAWIGGLRREINIDLYGTNFTGAGLASLKTCKVRFLRILGHAAPRPPDDLLRGVRDMHSLLWLHIKGIPLTDEHVKRLAVPRCLEALWIVNGRFTAAGVAHLSSSRKLQSLFLLESEISPDAVQALTAFKGITLGLCRSGITDEHLALLKTGFQATWVELSETKVTAAGLLALPRLPERLSIVDTGIQVTVEFLDAIKALGCKELEVRFKMCDPAALRRVGRLPKVREPRF